MIWVTWRQYRVELVIGALILAAISAYLLQTSVQVFGAYRDSGLEACIRVDPNACWDPRGSVLMAYRGLDTVVGWFQLAPGIIGVLLAAPLILEFDRRTYRLAWTQSLSRRRWLWTKLGVALLGAVVFAAAFTSLMTWWYGPFDTAEIGSGHLALSYPYKGALPLAYTVFTLALAVSAGAASRRAIAAAPIGLVGFILAQLVLQGLLRGFSVEINVADATTVVDRFWQHQIAEAGILLAAAALFMGATVWIVSRRMQ